MDKKFEVVPLSKVQPDENQPRKFFDAAKISQLKKSIEKEGIISPLIVERVADGYLLLDGERRYRAATELGLKEVPVIVEEPRNKIERRTRQFVVQEQHEGWTPSEKASALIELSEEIGISLYEVCKLLNIDRSETGRYVAVAQLLDRTAFLRSEIPTGFAAPIRSVRNAAKRVTEVELKKEFTKADEKRVERRIIQSVKAGDILKPTDLTKLKDAFVKNPALVEEYLESTSATPSSLYLKAEAQGATYLRNLTINSHYVSNWARRFAENRDTKIQKEQLAVFKDAYKALGMVIDLAE